MNEAEKERLIKKDIVSIENRVRHAFNQGYEIGVKANKSEIPTSCGDAISRKYILDLIATKGANLDDDLLIVEQWIQDAPSVNPHPIECGDAISRQAVIERINKQRAELKPDIYPQDKIGEAAYRVCIEFIKDLPPVTPQQRTRRWIGAEVLDKIRAEIAVLDDADYDYEGYYKAVTDAVGIIDKYKAEGSEK